jgi:hypothetical protein
LHPGSSFDQQKELAIGARMARSKTRNLLPAFLSVPENAVETSGDWTVIEAELGSPLPQDYKDFIATYGTGAIGDMPIRIFSPFPQSEYYLLNWREVVFEYYRGLYDDPKDIPYPLHPSPGGLLPWGYTGNGDYLQWRTKGAPDKWDIVTWYTDFHHFPKRTMTTFLIDIFEGRLDDHFPASLFPRPIQFEPVA